MDDGRQYVGIYLLLRMIEFKVFAQMRLNQVTFLKLAPALSFLLLSCATTATCLGEFTEVAISSRLNHMQFVQPEDPDAYQTYMSGGVAAGDFDNDGWADLYFTRLDRSNLLYRNLGNGLFENVTESAFGRDHLEDSQSNCATWGDIDNDGDIDLFVTSLFSDRYHLFVNDGYGKFTEEAEIRGASWPGQDLRFGYSATFGDYDLDGYLDLYVTEWRTREQNPNAAPQNSRLLRNLGHQAPGRFVDETLSAGVAMDEVTPTSPDFDSQTFTARFVDFDQDLYPELAIASDHGTSRLFWNNKDGTFTDGTRDSSVGTDQFGMGSAIGDIDGDGDFDWFVSSIFEENNSKRDGNRLFRNEGNRLFTDVTSQSNVRDGSWGWGAATLDFDNDGDLDLVQATGQVFESPSMSATSEGFETVAPRLWENDGSGSFTEIAEQSGLVHRRSGKGLATLDFDRDGDLDIVIANNGGSPSLYRNDADFNSGWLIISLVGTESNRQGAGSRLIADPDESTKGDEMIRDINLGNHFLGQSPPMAHFGLGDHEGPIDLLTVIWPSGSINELRDVNPNQELIVHEIVPEPHATLFFSLLLTINLIRSPRRNLG